jgi:hypothetical protein
MRLVPELTVPSADITLFFLSAEGLFYTSEIDDPWYSAHHIGKTAISTDSLTSGPKSKPVPFYAQDETVSVMACTSQYQICNPNADTKDGQQCSPLGGMTDLLNGFDVLWGNETEERKELMKWVYFVFNQGFLSIKAVVDIAGQSALAASYGLGWSINGPLPSTQWEDEVLLWHSASTASIQALFVDFANGPSLLPAAISAPPTTPQGHAFCTNQRIMSTRYSSFSILGVGIIFALGGALIVLDLVLESVLDWAQRSNPRSDYARLEWKSNATLQLQRLAHEEAGSRNWTHCTETVPITTRSNDRLRAFNISNIEHPRLSGPRSEVELVQSPPESPALSRKGEKAGWKGRMKVVTRQDSEQTLVRKGTMQSQSDSFSKSEDPFSLPPLPLGRQNTVLSEDDMCQSPVSLRRGELR